MNVNPNSTKPIRVLFADDHPIVRQGMEIALSAHDDIRLEALATNGKEAVALAKTVQPDVIIMDLQMPGHGRHHCHPRDHADRPIFKDHCVNQFSR